MFLQFFTSLRDAQVPVTLREYLTLMEALNADLAEQTVENFYYLSRASLVKDERNLDKFDRVFGTVFKGLESLLDAMEKADIPAEWLKKLAEKYLTEEEKKQIEALGGLEKLLETLRQRLAEQKGRHQGGKKWIGTAGTSPFGAYGYNPEGVRIGQDTNRNFRAVKVWDEREFRDLDGDVELGTRNIKIALRRLRKFARTGARTGFSAFFGVLTVSLAVSFAPPLPLIGSSISRWPEAALRGFLPLPLAFAGGADCRSLARLRLSASIRLMTLPPVFGAAFAGVFRPLRFWLISSTSAVS